MVQIIPNNQKRSFGEQVLGGLNEAVPGLQQYAQKQESLNDQKRENQQLSKLIGLDISQINDPKIKQTVVSEMLRSKGKEKLMGQKEQFLNQILGQGKGQKPSPNQQEQPEMQQEGFDASKLTDSQIAQATSLDPNLGRVLQHAKDVSLREQRENRNYNEAKSNKAYENQKDYIEKVTDSAQAADEMDMRLDQMMSLEDLPTPALATAMEALGIPPSLFSANAETAEKLSIDLTKNIQQFYGSRILQSEFSAFLKSIPSLRNSPEGRRRIVENMKKFNQLKRLEYIKTREEMTKYEDKNKPLPRDFRQKVFESMKPEANKLADDFKNANLKRKELKKPLNRSKVAPGTKVTDDLLDKYILNAKGDLSEAEKNIIEDGYDIE